MTLIPNETEQALNRQYDVYAAAREEYRKKISEQAARIEQLSEELEREKREAERAQDAYGVRFLNYLEETARLTDRIEQLEAALREIIGWLEDPEGGSHKKDMREASRIARAALDYRQMEGK